MSRLQQLQQQFQNYLIGLSNDIEGEIVSTKDALAEHRLGAYYNAYRIRLIDILANDYPAIEHYLGREVFEEVALDYLKIYPSTDPSVRWFGRHFADYFDKHGDRQDREFLHELALFEWRQGLVFDATNNVNTVHLEDMANIPADAWPDLKIHFKPALQWLDLHWNASQYANAVGKKEAPPEAEKSALPQRWLLWRKNQNPNWRSLEVHEAWAIEKAHQGGNFAQICEGLCEWISADQVALSAASFLKQWISDEIVVAIEH